MKRVIKDFKSISDDVIALINEQYPNGYDDAQLVSFVNAKGEFVKALEVKTDEITYLIKIDRKLDEHINEYIDNESEGEDFGFEGGAEGADGAAPAGAEVEAEDDEDEPVDDVADEDDGEDDDDRSNNF